MRTRGRRLYPSTLAERRLMLQLGSYPMYVPRGISPFLLARRFSRAARNSSPDLEFVRGALSPKNRPRTKPMDAPTDVSAAIAQ